MHDDLDDSFYLVSGLLAMRCGEQTFAVGPGGYVALPPAYRTPSGWWAMSPPSCCRCTPMTRSCVSSGRPAAGGQPDLPPAGPIDLDAAFQMAARTGQPVVGPPMSEEEAAVIAAWPV